MNALQRFLKRILDLIVSLVVLLLFGWLILLAALIALIDTGMSGFFRQTRVGQGGKSFDVFKIRSMRRVKGLDSTVTTGSDPRVSSFGRILRKTKLDELPQIINVLTGEMSLVGPRPTVDEDAQRMNERQKERFSVKPGITGLAQINGNTSLKWPERIEYDLEYVHNGSVGLDIKILWQTLVLILTNRAETHPPSDSEW